MPLFNWQVMIHGQTEAPSEEVLAKTLANQVSISLNVAHSVQPARIIVEPASNIQLAQEIPRITL